MTPNDPKLNHQMLEAPFPCVGGKIRVSTTPPKDKEAWANAMANGTEYTGGWEGDDDDAE